MHYESFRAALDDRFPITDPDPLPRCPLIVDLGCGPATTLFALCDWMRERRKNKTSVGYIGIDVSQQLIDFALEMCNCPQLFDDTCRFVLRRSVGALTDEDIGLAAQARDGVIFALSYVVHQDFMHDMRLMADLMRRVRSVTAGLPTWFLLQDANFPDRDGITEIWPEQRVNRLANQCEDLGYVIRSWKTKFVAPRVLVTPDGQFQIGEAGSTNSVCHFFHQIA